MLSFTSKNDIFFFCMNMATKKTDQGDGKPTYFYI